MPGRLPSGCRRRRRRPGRARPSGWAACRARRRSAPDPRAAAQGWPPPARRPAGRRAAGRSRRRRSGRVTWVRPSTAALPFRLEVLGGPRRRVVGHDLERSLAGPAGRAATARWSTTSSAAAAGGVRGHAAGCAAGPSTSGRPCATSSAADGGHDVLAALGDLVGRVAVTMMPWSPMNVIRGAGLPVRASKAARSVVGWRAPAAGPGPCRAPTGPRRRRGAPRWPRRPGCRSRRWARWGACGARYVSGRSEWKSSSTEGRRPLASARRARVAMRMTGSGWPSSRASASAPARAVQQIQQRRHLQGHQVVRLERGQGHTAGLDVDDAVRLDRRVAAAATRVLGVTPEAL